VIGKTALKPCRAQHGKLVRHIKPRQETERVRARSSGVDENIENKYKKKTNSVNDGNV